MTIDEALSEGRRFLTSIDAPSLNAPLINAPSFNTPSLDAALLLAETLKTSREKLLAKGNEPIAAPRLEQFFGLLERRKKGECIAYILGRKEFRGLEFTVNPNVLVPRPDTETLVEAALQFIDRWQSATGNAGPGKGGIPVLDLCTGSGAIAISLKNERPALEITASDISPEALETASHNAALILDKNCFSGEAICFIQSNLFDNIPGKYRIIVSNPPYVPSKEIDTLAPEARMEPSLALDGGEDGLDLIRSIIWAAQEHLIPGGILLLEASPCQMGEIRQRMEKCRYAHIKIHKDLAGMDRVISGMAK